MLHPGIIHVIMVETDNNIHCAIDHKCASIYRNTDCHTFCSFLYLTLLLNLFINAFCGFMDDWLIFPKYLLGNKCRPSDFNV